MPITRVPDLPSVLQLDLGKKQISLATRCQISGLIGKGIGVRSVMGKLGQTLAY
jgi:hypothetical protein